MSALFALRALLYFGVWIVVDHSAKPANLIVGVLASLAAAWVSLKLLPPHPARAPGPPGPAAAALPVAVAGGRPRRRAPRLRAAIGPAARFRRLPDAAAAGLGAAASSDRQPDVRLGVHRRRPAPSSSTCSTSASRWPSSWRPKNAPTHRRCGLQRAMADFLLGPLPSSC